MLLLNLCVGSCDNAQTANDGGLPLAPSKAAAPDKELADGRDGRRLPQAIADGTHSGGRRERLPP
jgi:hypothetical protein